MIETPTIDWAGLSPLIALLGGALVVLVVGLGRPRWIREGARAAPGHRVVRRRRSGCAIWQWGEDTDLMEGALRFDELTLTLTLIFCVAGIAATLLSWRHVAPREAAHGEYYFLLLSATAGMFVLVAATNLVTLFLGLELLSIPLYVLCAVETRREGSLESGLKYLIVGSVGSATLLFGLAFLYGATGSTDFAGIASAIDGPVADDSLLLRRHRARDGRPRLQGLRRAVPPVDAGRLRGRPHAGHGVHGGGDEGGGARRDAAPLRRRAHRRQRRVAAGARLPRRGDDHRRQRRRARADVAEADARVLVGRAGGLHARGRRRRDPARRAGDGLLPRRVPGDEPRRRSR